MNTSFKPRRQPEYFGNCVPGSGAHARSSATAPIEWNRIREGGQAPADARFHGGKR
jgi:hypothetical protein